MRLVPFTPADADLVSSWAVTPDDWDRWASLDHAPTPAIFVAWHADPDTHARLLVGERPAAYGELWVSEEEDEVELGRLLVAPVSRGQGVGRTLVRQLVEEARALPVSTAWVRIVPDNVAALRCYAAAGFAPVSSRVESHLNDVQPRTYRWLSLAL